MKLKYGRYYTQISADGQTNPIRCTGTYANGFSYEFIDDDFDSISEEFVSIEGNSTLTYTEIFKEVKERDHNKDLFTVVLKMATCETVQGDWCGMDSSMARHLEFEHGLFSEFWRLSRADEKAWIDKHAEHRSPIREMSDDIWYEHIEVCDRVITFIQEFKKFLAEVPTK